MRIKKKLIIKKLALFIILFSQVFYLQSVAAESTSKEIQIQHYIDAQRQEQLIFLERLVDINSGTTNINGVHQIGEILKSKFEQLGFKVHWVEEPNYMNRAGTLVIEHQGRKGKKLLLIGHLDTVFSKDSPFQKFELHGTNATGPGVIDDKGGDVVILYALKALRAVGVLNDMTITVVLTGDEEDSGKPTSISRKPLFLAAQHSDIALDFEWGITADTATIARRGIAHWMINTQGKGVHSSQIFQKSAGYGAIFALTRILDTMRTRLCTEKYLSFSPGLILGGSAVNYNKNNSEGTAAGEDNVIANTAMAKGDLRFLTPEQETNAKEKISAWVNQYLTGTTAIISFHEGIPSMPPSAANLALLKKYSEVSTSLGYLPIGPLDPGLRGAADISHIASRVSANLAGLGPIGRGAHSTKETLDIKSLPMQTKKAAVLIYRLTR